MRPTRFRIHPLPLALVLALAVALGAAFAQDEDGDAPFALETVAEGMNSPVQLATPPGDDRRFVVDRVGVIYRLEDDGTVAEEPFLDLRDQVVELQEGFDERGLLGLAFHPNFMENGRYYVYYSAELRDEAPDDWNHTARVSEFKGAAPGDDAPEDATRGDANTTDMNSERVLMRIDQPQFNHDGGAVAFGPDGYLYIALGDGGAANDVALGHPPMGHGQDKTSLLGSILRIDVDRGWPGYAVPESNPLVDERGPDEIYSWGWRNPWRMSFDAAGNGDLYVGTNGQALWEAVYEASETGNYGWNILEGTHCFDPANPQQTPDECTRVSAQGEPLKLPVIEYPHPANQGDSNVAGVSVVGGYVYRGEAIPELQGHYVFGDWQNQIFTADVDASTMGNMSEDTIPMEQVMQLEQFVLGFGQDGDNELYVLTTENTGPVGDTGAVHKIVPAGDGN